MVSIFPDLSRFPYFALDTEATGLIYPRDKVFGFSISTPDGKDHYWDVRTNPQSLHWLRTAVNCYTGVVIAHNASFDHKMLLTAGVDVPKHLWDDTVIRACLIDEHLFSYALDDLGKRYLNIGKDDTIYAKLSDLYGGVASRNVQMKNLHRAPADLVQGYAKQDTRVTLELWEWQEREIAKQHLSKISKFERRVLPEIINNEVRGIRVDTEYAQRAMEDMTPHIDRSQGVIDSLSGTKFNVNSSPQIRAFFQPKEVKGQWFVGDTPIGKTPSGNPSLDSPTLRAIGGKMATEILELRSLIKTRDTFLKNHILASATGGRVYPSISQNKNESGGTGTGRLAYRSPALQQIPSRNKEIAKLVKSAFLPDEGDVWVDTDMASFEVRVFAHLINDPKLVEAYQKDPTLDMHQYVADLTGLPRSASYAGQPYAKALNLSAIFNSGNGAIAEQIGLPWKWESFETRAGETVTYKKAGKEALALLDVYHSKVGGIRELAAGCKNVAQRRGYIYTKQGRHLRFPRGEKTYKASGILIQSTSADINKQNWLTIGETVQNGRLLLNTHDSYSLSLPEDTWQQEYNNIKEQIEKPNLRVPLVLDFNGASRNWWEALSGDIVT